MIFVDRRGHQMANTLQQRLAAMGIAARVQADRRAGDLLERPSLAVVSSHLGTSSRRHARVCRYLARSMLDARRDGRVVLVAEGSAIEPWAIRAAELFGVPWVRVALRQRKACQQDSDWKGCEPTVAVSADANRDELVIAMADRVDCVLVRRKGRIDAALRKRLGYRRDVSTRVAIEDPAVDRQARGTAGELMSLGALGWYCPLPISPTAERAVDATPRRLAANDWARDPADDRSNPDRDVWLVHCTRTCDGPWPGQTLRQHLDALFLGAVDQAAVAKRTPLDSLRRILRTRRLVASAITSDRRYPVVCFSELPLQRLLSRRRYRPHLHRWDYEPYGIAIRKSAAIAMGIRPVVYGTAADRKRLAEENRYRFQARGTTYDWREEREWRHRGDVELDRFRVEDVRAFVADAAEASGLPDRFAISEVGHWTAEKDPRMAKRTHG
jgi:hypothetical protein